MKAIRTKEVNENVKAANSCLRKAKRQAKELAVFTGEVVRLIDKEGHSLQGFFNRVEFVLVDGTIKFRVVINPILECENCIMASCHEDYLYEVVSVEKFGVVSKCWHNLFLCAKPRLSQARALLLPKVLVSLGISFRYGKVTFSSLHSQPNSSFSSKN